MTIRKTTVPLPPPPIPLPRGEGVRCGTTPPPLAGGGWGEGLRRPNRLALAALALLAGCEVGPDYERPSAPVPDRFKEADGWKPAEPKEAASDAPWWSVYDDKVLDGLEKKIDISNQRRQASEAAWRQAVALADQAQAGLFPTLGVTASATRSGGGARSGGGGSTELASTGGGTSSHGLNQFQAGASASWDLDIWGKIRRTIENATAAAQASEADLAAARLSAQATLATDYFELRVADEQEKLLDETIKAYERSTTITLNQYKAGVAAKSDVITAETQLESAQSQRIALGVSRATLEHAIAVLDGATPAEVSIAVATLTGDIPVAPAGVPSTLLERRPDIAEAERKMEAANAEIGVAIAAYYPDLTLSGSYGYSGSKIGSLFQASNALWSFGGTLAETVIDFGAREAQVAANRAAWDQSVATYRQTVLAAFQQTEDELATLRILEQQAAVEEKTVASANLAVQLALNEYKAGTVSYTTVVTAQATALSEAQSLLAIRQNRLVASVTLIQALGGGWSADKITTK